VEAIKAFLLIVIVLLFLMLPFAILAGYFSIFRWLINS